MGLIISKEYPFSKVGINEVKGLKDVLKSLMAPVQTHIKNHIYWSDVDLTESEYTSRDGFIPHSHNCGGIEISEVIPKCEQYEFGFLEFGECDPEYCECHKPDPNGECALDIDGHNDAKLRVWLKFEGINEQDEMEFYLYMGGGNGDAPYFRVNAEATIFEAQFTAKTLSELKRVGAKHINNLIKAME
jgi:hypothetical protein